MTLQQKRTIGIIDIGSNSVRLVIYAQFENGASRVISEHKESPRLSGLIKEDGTLPEDGITLLSAILTRFHRIGSSYAVSEYRAVATAAVRNAANSQQIIDEISRTSGIQVKLLSGQEEAQLGFAGMINTMDVTDGYLVDIGGGSTEVTLFRGRKRLHSVSFPFGAVNMTRKFAPDGEFTSQHLEAVRSTVKEAVRSEGWIGKVSGLPMIGLGGTLRTLCKIHQKQIHYSLNLTHQYTMTRQAVDEIVEQLAFLPGERRKKVDGLAKDRSDIIVPGMIILQTLAELTGTSHYIVSGAGLRDGLYFEGFAPGVPEHLPLAERSADLLYALHPFAPPSYIERVQQQALLLFDGLRKAGSHPYDDRIRLCLSVAAKLHRIGTAISSYQHIRHTYYMIVHSRIDGMTHRELVITALIASFKGKAKLQELVQLHQDVLLEDDLPLLMQLGYLLMLAKALDKSETGEGQLQNIRVIDSMLVLETSSKQDPSELFREVSDLSKDFHKAWGLSLELNLN